MDVRRQWKKHLQSIEKKTTRKNPNVLGHDPISSGDIQTNQG